MGFSIESAFSDYHLASAGCWRARMASGIQRLSKRAGVLRLFGSIKGQNRHPIAIPARGLCDAYTVGRIETLPLYPL